MKNKVRIREVILARPLKWSVRLYAKLFLHFKYVSDYKPQKGEKIVVLSNHQTDLDPAFIRLSFNRYLYFLSSDNIYSKPLRAKLISYLGGIPKRKGVPDFESIRKLMQIAKDGGSICIFPEGNRSYAEFQFYIADNFASLLMKLKGTLVLYNIHGGFGVMPRFGAKRRKGKLYGEVKRVLKYEDYKDMKVEELSTLIKENLKVFDSESGELYKSNRRAEYLERMYFVCPKCQHMNTLVSNGNIIKCNDCGLEVEYLENLTLKSNDSSFKYHRLNDWYQYQKEFVKNMDIGEGIIFQDDNVKLRKVNPFIKEEKLAKGTLTLYKDHLTVGDYSIDVANIVSASPMSGRKLCFTYNTDNYEIKGDKRFNALKYALIFHKLDTKMHKENLDNYYSLD